MNIRCLSVAHLLLFLCIGGLCAAQEPTMRFYVRPGGNDEADGLSWETAFASPQAAANAVESLFIPAQGQVYEVWLAAGTYTRSAKAGKEESTPTAVVEANKRISVSFYGGYSGVEEHRDDRSWMENMVILDGGGDHACFAVDTRHYSGYCGSDCDEGEGEGESEQEYAPEDGTIVVDGFTLQNASDAFFWKGDVTPEFRHCVLRGNNRSIYGGCAYVTSPRFIDSLIVGPAGIFELHGCESYISFLGSSVVGVTGSYSVLLEFEGGGHLRSSVIWDCAPLLVVDGWTVVTNSCVCAAFLSDIQEYEVSIIDTIYDDPQFVDAANGDFRLQETSPCVDTGIALEMEGAAQDLLGIARPQGLGWDMGAYEYHWPDPGMEYHTADQNQDGAINLSELLRLVQFRNSDGYHCEPGTEDGYAPGPGDQTCLPHQSDYNPADWTISLSELLRLIQFYNSNAYHACPGEGTEDGYCVGLSQ